MSCPRPTPLRVVAAFASAIVALILVTPARADVQIEYDLSRSRITAFAGLVELSPSALAAGAPFGGASARITLAGGLLEPQDGIALVEDFQLGNVPIDENLFDVVHLQGSASAQQVGVAVGQLVGQTSLLVSPTQPFSLATAGSVACTPFEYCGAIGAFPLDLAGIQSLSPLGFELRNLDVSGRSTLRGRIALELDGQSAIVDLLGVEMARHFVPEPAALAQLAAGCLGLAALHGLAPGRRSRRA